MVKDIYGRELKVGALVLMRKYELNPYKIVSIEGPIVQRSPMGLVSLTKIHMVSEITVNVAGDNGASIESFIVKEPEVDADGNPPEKKSNLLTL